MVAPELLTVSQKWHGTTQIRLLRAIKVTIALTLKPRCVSYSVHSREQRYGSFRELVL